MKLHIIGAGGPRPRKEFYGSACVLEVGDELIMVDCGPGATYRMVKMGILPTQVDTLFITHHHTDHNVDFACFALLRFDLDNGDLTPLRVIGPPPTERFVDGLVGENGVFSPDIVSRREHPVALHNFKRRGGILPRPDVKVKACDVDSGSTIETDHWKATAVCVPHLEPYLVSLAYRIDTEEGSLLFLGDAGISPEAIELAKGVDTLVTGIIGMNTREGETPDPHHNVSADVPDIVDITQAADISRVVGVHGAPSTGGAEQKLREGYNGVGFDGEVICPAESTTVEL